MLVIYKPIGLSPLEHINKLKSNEKIKSKKVSYAGRLDPMAHGLMIYLLEEECKLQENYINLNKTYKFKLAFGISTDTYDILGRINNISDILPTINDIELNTKSFIGESYQKYPPFSSIKVDKKPLWKHSLENNIDNINIPQKLINVFNLKLLNTETINFISFRDNVLSKINLMKSKKFRNKEIIEDWKNIKLSNIIVAEFITDVSSGTYIRNICNTMGNNLKCGGIAYDILRTKIGSYEL